MRQKLKKSKYLNRNMPIDFKEMMSKMSDYEINGYIENRKNYTKEAVIINYIKFLSDEG